MIDFMTDTERKRCRQIDYMHAKMFIKMLGEVANEHQ